MLSFLFCLLTNIGIFYLYDVELNSNVFISMSISSITGVPIFLGYCLYLKYNSKIDLYKKILYQDKKEIKPPPPKPKFNFD